MTDHRPLVERLYHLTDGRRYDELDRILTADCVLVTPDTSQTGRAAIAAHWAAYARSFPDSGHAVTATYSAADVVTVEGVWHGTNTGPLATPQGELPATGRRVELPFCAVAQIRDGRFCTMHVYCDVMSMLAQLGLVPQPAAA